MSSKDKASSTDNKAQNKARKVYEEAVFRAFRTFRETKEQADIAHEKALKQAIGEQAKKEADIAHKEALEQARKVRDEVMDEAHRAFTIACGQSDDSGNSKGEKS